MEVEQTAPISPPSSSSASSNGSDDYLGELGSQEVDDGFTTGATTGASNATTVETGMSHSFLTSFLIKELDWTKIILTH